MLSFQKSRVFVTLRMKGLVAQRQSCKNKLKTQKWFVSHGDIFD